MSSDAPDPPAKDETHARALLARRVEFAMIGLGGVFIIFGWGFGHQEWARALGWAFTGIGFAIEMVYGRVLKPASKAKARAEPAPEPPAGPASGAEARVPDESAS